MGKIYVGSSGNRYKVMAWKIADIRSHRQIWKYKVSIKFGKEWHRYPHAKYFDTPEEAEQELEVFARRKGWSLCAE